MGVLVGLGVVVAVAVLVGVGVLVGVWVGVRVGVTRSSIFDVVPGLKYPGDVASVGQEAAPISTGLWRREGVPLACSAAAVGVAEACSPGGLCWR